MVPDAALDAAEIDVAEIDAAEIDVAEIDVSGVDVEGVDAGLVAAGVVDAGVVGVGALVAVELGVRLAFCRTGWPGFSGAEATFDANGVAAEDACDGW